MNRTEKETFVVEFRERVGKTPVVYLTDFTGLDVKAITELRQSLKDIGAEYLVVKNRLVKRALSEEEGFPDLSESLLGPTGVVFGYQGAVEPAKAVSDFAKAHNDKPVFKIGVLDSQVLDASQIERLAQLPSREQLLAELAGAFQAPASALASALGALLQETAGLVDALRIEREAEG